MADLIKFVEQELAAKRTMSREQADLVIATAKRKSEPPIATASSSQPPAAHPQVAEASPPSQEGAALPEMAATTQQESEADADGLPPPERSSDPPAATLQVSESARERAAFAAAAESAEPDPMAIEDRRSRGTLIGWAAAVALLFAVGFWLERASETDDPGPGRLRVVGDPHSPAPATGQKSRAEPMTAKPNAPASAVSTGTNDDPALARADVLVAPEDSGFAVHAGIIDPNVNVTPKQGLLVVEGGPGSAGASLAVDEQRVGLLPAKIALSEGVHELAISLGDRTSYRYLSVRAGKSWVLKTP